MVDHEHDSWRPIRRGATRRQLMEASLVLTAVDVEHVVVKDEADWCLRVPDPDAADAIAHLEKYQLENRPLPALPAPDQVDSGWMGVLGFLLVIWLVPSLQANVAFGWVPFPWNFLLSQS